MKRKQSKCRTSKLIHFLLVLLVLSAGIFFWTLWAVISAQKDFQRVANQFHGSAIETEPTCQSETVLPVATEAERIPPATTATEPEMLERFRSLYEENPEIFGWLTIPDTLVDYPVMYTPEDPEKYLHRSFLGERSFSGTLFLDARCTTDSDNLIIYGHNMLDGSMFRTLIRYEQESYWKAHPTFSFDTLYSQGEYEVMAAFYDKVYGETEDVFKFYQFIDPENEPDFDWAMENYRQKALYDTGVTARYGDKLLTLVTCAYHTENGRFVVVARKMNDVK